MPISQTETLKELVLSLSKAEKRHFRMYVQRLSSNKDVLFLRLFDTLDKMGDLTEIEIKLKLNIQNPAQYTNAKRHLYSQILKSLRLIHIEKDKGLKVREQIDFASILYARGLYKQCFIILERIKPLAESIEDYILLLEILELQKKIESRHITRSRKIRNHIEGLITASEQVHAKILGVSQLLNWSLQMQGIYIKLGFVRNERDLMMLKTYYDVKRRALESKNMSFIESIMWCQSHVWFNHMNQHFEGSLKYANQWVAHFENNAVMKTNDADLFVRGIHYKLTYLFYLKKKKDFHDTYNQFKKYFKSLPEKLNHTSKSLNFIYYQNASLNAYVIANKYTGFEQNILVIKEALNSQFNNVDPHRLIVFNYKFAMIYSYRGNYEKSIDYLNDIMGSSQDHLREDIYTYSRLLQLMCHYRLGNFELVDNLIQNVRQTFNNNNLNTKVVELILLFLRKGCKSMNFGLNDEYNDAIKKLKKFQKSPFEKVAFIYYNYIDWFESLSTNQSIEKTINLKLAAS